MTTAKTITRLLPLALCCFVQLSTAGPARAQCEATESAALTAPEGTGSPSQGAHFGCAVATDGTVLITGAEYDDQDGEAAGAAYVYRWDGATWLQEAKLRPADGRDAALFGRSLAFFGDTFVIGSDSGPPQGPGGAAYVFRNIPVGSATWVEQAKLVPADSSYSDSFSRAISLYDDVAVIGSPFKDDPGENSGSAYIFRRDNNGTPGNPSDDSWAQEAKLVRADPAAGDRFGDAVAVWGDFVLVSSSWDDDLADQAGSVYVFRWTGSAWTQHQKLTASVGQERHYFGESVAFREDWALIGASGDNDLAYGAGAVYAFQRDDNGTPGNSADDTWVERSKLYAGDPGTYNAFGGNVAMAGESAVFAAFGDYFEEPGHAYIFRSAPESPDYWVQQARLTSRAGYAPAYETPAAALAGDIAVMGIDRHWDEQEHAYVGATFVYRGLATDCNANETIDLCDIADGTSQDQNTNGLPDECEPGIPTVSTLGLAALIVLMVSGGIIVTTRRRVPAG